MKTDMKTSYSIRQLLREMNDDILLVNHILQRASNQWKQKEKSLLIDSVLRGVAIKPITVQLETADNDSRKWLLDGKQRLSVFQEFVGNKDTKGFALSKSIEPIEAKMPKMVQATDENGELLYEKIGRKKVPVMYQERDENGRLVYEMQSIELKGKTFDKLPKSLQEAFLNYHLMPVLELSNCTEEEVQRQILRENISAKMNPSQIGTVLSGEQIATFLKGYQDNELFLNIATINDTDRNRGLVERLVAESFVLMYESEKWAGYEVMAKKFNSIMTEERIEEYKSIFRRFQEVVMQCGEDRLFNEWISPKNIYIILKNFKYFIDLDCYADVEYGKFLVEWFKSIKDNTEYVDFDVSTTKGKKNVQARYEIMEEEMNSYMEQYGEIYTESDCDEEFTLEGTCEDLETFGQEFVSDKVAMQTLILNSEMPYSNFEDDTLKKAVDWYIEFTPKNALEECLEYKEWISGLISDEDVNLPFFVYAIRYIFVNDISINIDDWLTQFKTNAFANIDDKGSNFGSNSTIMLKESEIIKSINDFIKEGDEEDETI